MSRRRAASAVIALLGGLWLASGRSLAGDLSLIKPRPDPHHGTTSRAARQSAVQGIPVEKLEPQARTKVFSVLSNISVFRRMPVGVVDCDPDLYLFLVRHPDVVVNIWEVLKISQLKLRQVDENTYHMSDAAGTSATVEFLYRSHDTHLAYAEGSYDGPLTARPVKGRCLMVLKTGYVREPDGRYYITSRLDTFMHVEPGGAELLTKTFQPLVGKVADNNFLQSVAFLGSLSRTAEVNTRGVQLLASQLARVQPDLRQRLANLAAEVAGKQAATSASPPPATPRVAIRNGPTKR